MTDQEILNKVYSFILKQGPSMSGGNCLYRKPGPFFGLFGGTKMCAAGCLIKDQHYSKSMERKSVRHGPVIDALEKSGVPESALAMLQGLQGAHDGYAHMGDTVGFREVWQRECARIAKTHNLELPA